METPVENWYSAPLRLLAITYSSKANSRLEQHLEIALNRPIRDETAESGPTPYICISFSVFSHRNDTFLAKSLMSTACWCINVWLLWWAIKNNSFIRSLTIPSARASPSDTDWSRNKELDRPSPNSATAWLSLWIVLKSQALIFTERPLWKYSPWKQPNCSQIQNQNKILNTLFY